MQASMEGFHGSCAQWHDKKYILYNILLVQWTASYSMGISSPSLEGQWVRHWPEHEADLAPPCSAKVKNEWISTSTAPNPSMIFTWMDVLCAVQSFPFRCARMVAPYITTCVPDNTIQTPTAQLNFGHAYQSFITYRHSHDTVTSSSNLWSFCQQFRRLTCKVVFGFPQFVLWHSKCSPPLHSNCCSACNLKHFSALLDPRLRPDVTNRWLYIATKDSTSHSSPSLSGMLFTFMLHKLHGIWPPESLSGFCSTVS
jgi:hypothetical protein